MIAHSGQRMTIIRQSAFQHTFYFQLKHRIVAAAAAWKYFQDICLGPVGQRATAAWLDGCQHLQIFAFGLQLIWTVDHSESVDYGHIRVGELLK